MNATGLDHTAVLPGESLAFGEQFGPGRASRALAMVPSGDAGFGGGVFETLRKFYGTDRIPFTFVSDELAGGTADNAGVIRVLMSRGLSSLSEAKRRTGRAAFISGH